MADRASAPARSRTGGGGAASRAAPAAGRTGASAGNQALQAALQARGRPLDRHLAARAGRQLGTAISEVRISDGTAAAATIPAMRGARGVHASGVIALAPSATPLSLAHELVHEAQWRRFGNADPTVGGSAFSRYHDPAEQEARRLAPLLLAGTASLHIRERPRSRWHRDGPEFVIVPVAGTADPLAAYGGLRERLAPADWNALNAAARRRSEQIRTGQLPAAENERVSAEISMPLSTIFQPQVNESRAAGGDQWLRDLFAIGVTEDTGATAAMGARLQEEILHRWLNDNIGILQELVTIGLVDPEARGTGAVSLLAFTFRGHPVTPRNGLLTLAAVDESLGSTLTDTLATI